MAQTLIKELQMIFQTSNVSICNGNMKYPIETSVFHTILRSSSFMFPLLLITVEVKNTIYNSLKNYVYHKLAKFDQNQMIRNIQNFELFYEKPFSHVKHSDMSLAPFWKRFLQVKQFHDAKVFNTRLPSFVIPKITFDTWNQNKRCSKLGRFHISFGDRSYP